MSTFFIGLFTGAVGAALAYVFRARIETAIQNLLSKWRK